MKSIISIRLCALGALLFTSLPVRADDGKDAIKGGVGIGPIRLKMDVTEAEKIFGKTSDAVSMGPGARIWFVRSASGKEEEIVVTIRRAEDGQHYYVNEVAVTSPDFRTPAGNSTRSDLAAIWREFPDLAKVETGDSMDGTIMTIYSSRASGVSVMVERPPGTPTSDRPDPGVPSGKCRCFIVQAVGDNGNFVQLGIPPKKTDGD